jgi:hypothetical protein
MKTVYTAVMARLKEQVPELKWIDLDAGQLDVRDKRPPLAYPCALVDIAVNNCRDLYAGVQLCHALVSVRVAQNLPSSRTGSATSGDVRNNALRRFDLIEKVYVALRDFDDDGFNPLSRTGQTREKHPDGLFVCRIDFQTDFRDDTAPGT